jgi:large subunit ribosomal protein L24e
MAYCSFCGKLMQKGTGVMLVKKDGKILYFCSTKCDKNSEKLGRKARTRKWTLDSRKERGKVK